jgi:hypothetical protein
MMDVRDTQLMERLLAELDCVIGAIVVTGGSSTVGVESRAQEFHSVIKPAIAITITNHSLDPKRCCQGFIFYDIRTCSPLIQIAPDIYVIPIHTLKESAGIKRVSRT